VTFLVGENGSGKSTLIEALAQVYPRDGVRNPFVNLVGAESSEEDSPLPYNLKPKTHKMASPAGFFLRAEKMHDFAATVDADQTQSRAWGGEKLQERSHGESFLTVLRYRFADVGVYFMDEPESALSFQSCLSLVRLLDLMRSEGSQVIVSTHSPILVTLPGATIFELGPWGMRRVDSYNDLELVKTWRDFLEAPDRFLRHLLQD
jgi:predicted ATPase